MQFTFHLLERFCDCMFCSQLSGSMHVILTIYLLFEKVLFVKCKCNLLVISG